MATGLIFNRRLPERSKGEVVLNYKEQNTHELLSNLHDNSWTIILKTRRRNSYTPLAKKFLLPLTLLNVRKRENRR
jgi:hypothetical protein